MLQIVNHFGQNISSDYKCYKCTNCIEKNIYAFPNELDEKNVIPINEIEEQYEKNGFFPNHGEENIELINTLKKYRREISLDKQVPEYAVFNNKELNWIVSSQPKNINDLKKTGVSQYTIDNYGDVIINIVTQKSN